jgi:lipid II:glycine glycyltransferase (peptidoglycan interpeptide bridge formation enzyme)
MDTKDLSSEYTVEVDHVTKEEWSELLQSFEDANIYQTWSYGAVRWGEDHLSHLVLKKDEKATSLAQLRIIKLPIIRAGIAYLFWGPVWHVRGEEINLENILQMIKALREEYLVRRRFLLRIIPNEIETNNNKICSILEDEGFRRKATHSRTFLLDLTPSLEELRKNLTEHWRRNLKKAEKNELKLKEGTGDGLYETVSILFKDMLSRKGFVSGIDINQFRAIQNSLPESIKMRIMVCEFKGNPVSALVCSAMGDTGILLIGATSTNGMNLRGSFLLQWRMIQWLKEIGCRYYDLGGINPGKNTGVYHFKAGFRGRDVYYIGQFDASESIMSSVPVICGDKLRVTWRKMRIDFNRIKNMIRDVIKFRKTEGKKKC